MLKSKINQIKKGAISFFMVAVLLVSMCGVSVSAATIKKPTVKSVKATSASTIVVKWNKVSGAKGYVVYQKMGNKSFKKVATITSKNKTSYTAKKLNSDTKYSYKIKSYTVKNGKKVYSKYSNVKFAYTKHAHKFVGYECRCGLVDDVSAYLDLKDYVLENGEVNGAYMGFEQWYKGRNGDVVFRLRYNSYEDYLYLDTAWINSNGHTVWTMVRLDNYEYFTSIYIDQNQPNYLYNDYVEGYLDSINFTTSSPLNYKQIKNTYYTYAGFVEASRVDICNLIQWLDEFMQKQGLDISVYDLGFLSFTY